MRLRIGIVAQLKFWNASDAAKSEQCGNGLKTSFLTDCNLLFLRKLRYFHAEHRA